MPKPFKFRHVNEIAGAFLACIVIVLVIGIVLAGRAQKWFGQSRHITIELPHEGAYGLKIGAEVRMMGTRIGQVDDITIDKITGQMTARASVSPQFAQFILTGDGTPNSASTAIIRIPPVLVDPFIEITRGKAGPPIRDKGVLPASPEIGASDAINQTLLDLHTRLLPAVESTLEEYKGLAADLRDPKGPVLQTLNHLNQLTANLERTDTIVGHLTNDKTLADKVNAAVTKLTASADDVHDLLANLKETAAELPGIAHSASAQINKMPAMIDQTAAVMTEAQKSLKNLEQATAQLPAVMASLKQTVDALPDVMVHTQQTLIEVQKLIRGMQELPFIRDNIQQTRQNTMLQPADVGGPP